MSKLLCDLEEDDLLDPKISAATKLLPHPWGGTIFIFGL